MKKLTQKVSIVALCLVMIVLSVVPAFATSYVENHDYVDCSNYYLDGSYYCYQIKIAKGTPLSAITVKNVFTDEEDKLSDLAATSYTSVAYQYTDSTSDCYLLSVYSYPGCPKYMWYEYGIKLYYDYNGYQYMATNTSYNSNTEGPGYILTR